MPAVTHSRQASVSIDELWAHVHDLSNWAADIPGYVAHTEIDPDESIWTVKGDLGALSKQVDFRVKVTERVAPSRVTFSLEGTTENVSGQGSFEARPIGAPARPLAVAAPPVPVVGGWRAALQRIVRRLFRRNFVSLQAVPPAGASSSSSPSPSRSPSPSPSAPAGGGATEFSFSLELQAGGMMGPVVNALLEPLLLPAAVDLADKIAASVERG